MFQRAFQTRSATVNVMAKAIFAAAHKMVRDFNEVEHLQVSKKGPGDFVSAADKRAEKILYTELKKARPDYGFLMEESGEVDMEGASHRWIIDPLDGTTNFLHGIPHFCISVALEKNVGKDGEITAAAIYDPIKDEMFWAEKGMGAYLNDKRLRVSTRQDPSDCLLATGIPSKGRGDMALFVQEAKTIGPQVAGIRRLGAAALDLAYVAAGRYDGYWERNLSPWDIAAGLLLITEAGGFVGSLDGGPILGTPGHAPASSHGDSTDDGNTHPSGRPSIIAGNTAVYKFLQDTIIHHSPHGGRDR